MNLRLRRCRAATVGTKVVDTQDIVFSSHCSAFKKTKGKLVTCLAVWRCLAKFRNRTVRNSVAAVSRLVTCRVENLTLRVFGIWRSRVGEVTGEGRTERVLSRVTGKEQTIGRDIGK